MKVFGTRFKWSKTLHMICITSMAALANASASPIINFCRVASTLVCQNWSKILIHSQIMVSYYSIENNSLYFFANTNNSLYGQQSIYATYITWVEDIFNHVQGSWISWIIRVIIFFYIIQSIILRSHSLVFVLWCNTTTLSWTRS
jgi:hypothetical protein